MATWSTIYLVIAVLVGGLGVWSFSRGRNHYLGVAGLLWFVGILLRFFIPSVGDLVIVAGMPGIANFVLYAAVPVFMLLAFFDTGHRRY
jgi:hypothetical protein